MSPGAYDSNVPTAAVFFIVDVATDFVFVNGSIASLTDLAVADAADFPGGAVLYAVAFVVSALCTAGESGGDELLIIFHGFLGYG